MVRHRLGVGAVGGVRRSVLSQHHHRRDELDQARGLHGPPGEHSLQLVLPLHLANPVSCVFLFLTACLLTAQETAAEANGDWEVTEEYGTKFFKNVRTGQEYETAIDPETGDEYYVDTVRVVVGHPCKN